MLLTLVTIYGFANATNPVDQANAATHGWRHLLAGALPPVEWHIVDNDDTESFWDDQGIIWAMEYGKVQCAKVGIGSGNTPPVYVLFYNRGCSTKSAFAALGYILLHASNSTPGNSTLFSSPMPSSPTVLSDVVLRIARTFGPATLCQPDRPCAAGHRCVPFPLHVQAPDVCIGGAKVQHTHVNKGLLLAYMAGIVCMTVVVSGCVFHAVCPFDSVEADDGESYATDEHLIEPETPLSVLRITDPTVILVTET